MTTTYRPLQDEIEQVGKTLQTLHVEIDSLTVEMEGGIEQIRLLEQWERRRGGDITEEMTDLVQRHGALVQQRLLRRQEAKHLHRYLQLLSTQPGATDYGTRTDLNSDIPVLPAWSYGPGKYAEWRVWCCYCLIYHHHSPGAGSRVAHCRREDSPYKQSGYSLEYAGEWEDRPTPVRRRRA